MLNPHLVKGGWTPEVRPHQAATPACLSNRLVHLPDVPHSHTVCARGPACSSTASIDRQGLSAVLHCPSYAACLALPVLRCPSACQEDALIIQMVGELGLGKWSVIASHLPGRIGKQCRER